MAEVVPDPVRVPASPRQRRIRRAWLVTGALVLAAAGLTAAFGWRGAGDGATARRGRGITRELDRPVPDDAPRLEFRDVAAEVGIAMTHGQGRRSSLLPEDMGPGAALEDLDLDGDLDLFLVNFAGPAGAGGSRAARPPAGGATHRLFRNDGGRFTDVTAGSGADVADFGIGAAAGDVDGDGLADLYVTCYGRNRMLRNLGGLRFEDVTERSGTGDDGFGAGAAFGDLDRDGDLDLYVCNYVEFDWDGRPPEPSAWGAYTLPATINPSASPPARNRFYRNRGDGTFTEEAGALGIDDPGGRSLSVTLADFSGDGWPDIYVLNDVSKNAYFESRGDGTFADRSVESLAADYRGAMGNAVADFDGDGDLDLFITHWLAQENAIYVNLVRERGEAAAGATFGDLADELGLGQVSLDFVGWGTAFLDYDLDGAPDLVVANGSTMEEGSDPARLVPQRPLLFWQKPGRGFFEVGRVSGAPWSERWNARALVDGDLDGDGDADLVVTSNRGPVRVLLNPGPPPGRHWLKVRPLLPAGNRAAVGAQVTVEAAGRRALQEVGAGTSYLAHRPDELLFGLGASPRADRIIIRWPDGTLTELKDVAADRAIVIGPGGEAGSGGR